MRFGKGRGPRSATAGLIAEAAAHPGGLVEEIDASCLPAGGGAFIPVEAIRGWHVVDPQGRLSGDFIPNKSHGTIRDDFTLVDPDDPALAWFPRPWFAAVRAEVEDNFRRQVSGCRLEWMKVIDRAVSTTSVLELDRDEEFVRVLLRQAGVSLPCAVGLLEPGRQREVVVGVCTFVGVRLDRPEASHMKVWFDVGWTRAQAESVLSERIRGVAGGA